MDTTGVACSDIVIQGEGVASGIEFLVVDTAKDVADAGVQPAKGVAGAGVRPAKDVARAGVWPAKGVTDAVVTTAKGVTGAGVPTALLFMSVFCDQDVSVRDKYITNKE